VEHACPRCNASVDDNIPFCPTCEASQIRATAKEYSHTPISVTSEASSVPLFAVEAGPHVDHARADGHAELRSALYAGVVGALISMIQPLASLVAVPFAGFLSVLLYRRRSSGAEPSPRAGFRLGALSGLFGFGLLMVLTAAGTLARHTEGDTHAAVIQIIQQAQARNPDPQARQAFEYFMTPQGMAFMMILGFVIMCSMFVLLSGIGGAISASLLRRKGPPQP
jgi:RNA polymerase subunit RPABC4/transcription elongation factor Spt4